MVSQVTKSDHISVLTATITHRFPVARLRSSTSAPTFDAESNPKATLTLPAGAAGGDLTEREDLSHLEAIVAHDSALEDDGLVPLTHCHRLKRLQLNSTPITDAGLTHLARLTALEELNLTGTQVTDAGLVHLQPLTRLKRFSFNGTTVSLSGVVRLFAQGQQRTLGDAFARFDGEGKIVVIDVAATSFDDEEMEFLGHGLSLGGMCGCFA